MMRGTPLLGCHSRPPLVVIPVPLVVIPAGNLLLYLALRRREFQDFKEIVDCPSTKRV
jgi:hypothetical protein